MFTRIFFVWLSLSFGLQANIEPFLKKSGEKTNPSLHKIANIDFIYMINLDERPDKYALSMQQLAPYSITPFRFSAVNGWKLSLKKLNKLGITYQEGMPKDLWGTYYPKDGLFQAVHEVMHVPGRVYYSHCLSRGAIGILLSHISVLQDAYDSGYKTVWIMEDDIEVIQNPHLLSDKIKKLDKLVGKKGWDILFTDKDTKDSNGNYVPCLGYARRPNHTPRDPGKFARRIKISSEFKKIGARYGTYSMIVRRSGMKKILDFFKQYQLFLPFDMEIFFPDVNVYAVRQDIVSTMPRAGSNNGIPPD